MSPRHTDEQPPKAIVPIPPFKWVAYAIAGGIGAVSVGNAVLAQSLQRALIVTTMLAILAFGALVVAAIVRGEKPFDIW